MLYGIASMQAFWKSDLMTKKHMSHSNDLITTLKNMNVTNVHDIEYMALYKGSKALDALTQLTMLPLDRCHYRPKRLKQADKKISK